MSWQEELRRLDVELATGRITQERYRKLRDELLAGNSGGTAPSPVASPLRRPAGQHWQSIYPDPRPQSTTPLTSAPLFPTDQPMSAPSPADTRATDSMPVPRMTNAPIDRSTVVRPADVRPSPPTIPMGMAQPGSTRSLDDPFPSALRSARKAVWPFIVLGVLLVLALIIGGIWWLAGSVSSQGPPKAAAPAPTVEKQLPSLPGLADKNNSTVSTAKGVELGLYPVQAADAFTKSGATEVIYRGSTAGDNAYFVLVVPTKTPQNARAVVDFLSTTALNSGFSQNQTSQFAVSGQRGDRWMSGTWYSSGNNMVNLWVSQRSNGDRTLLTGEFDRTLASLQKDLPAT
jgi:hypothetical protein